MNYNKIKMPSQNESDPVKTEPLSKSIERIRSFALLEEDEELMPVAQREIERSITIIEAIYAKLGLMPFFVAPTRSGGVGVEYQIRGAEAYYHFVPRGLIDFSVVKRDHPSKQILFTNLDEAAELLDLI